ncbi:ribosomal maturation YjgA family protein [Mucilaginibacter paludis]|uniref:DUF2809 domain-containing protein n=1 Tax=Mucilaginibacter paludis DSM 18603 TaxID=714943 RepID=H1YFG7_9SPHI|nr:DUF2809 domain-containing protein [Mucilaginibacter paludis]EHQ27275.1 hypothetical protein Mucpa_3171 [Mucilaginibacter paludis DSM 18603]
MKGLIRTPAIIYIFLIILSIILGFLSRMVTSVPLWVGDVLWATMVFFMVRFIFINQALKQVVIISLLFCYGIELSQLYQAEWINQIRQTTFGKLVLGQVFSWGDMLCYTVGIVIGALIMKMIGANKNNSFLNG